MTEPICDAGDYAGFKAALITRRKELGLSQIAVDHISGLQEGYTAKIEADMKGVGMRSLCLLLKALNVKIRLVHAAGLHADPVITAMAYVEMQKIVQENRSRKGGRIRMVRATASERRNFARQGAKVRWRKWREAKAAQERKEKQRLKRQESARKAADLENLSSPHAQGIEI